jgi:hypothetical protein
MPDNQDSEQIGQRWTDMQIDLQGDFWRDRVSSDRAAISQSRMELGAF